MISSTSFFNKICSFFLASLIFCAGCTNIRGSASLKEPAAVRNVRVVVYPVSNMPERRVALPDIRQLFIESLKSKGIDVLDDATLERFMVRHRIRYVEGLPAAESEAFKKEEGVDAVLIISWELYSETPPPKVAVMARLVSTGIKPIILWADSSAMAGDDSPGLLELGMIWDMQILLDKTVRYLSGSLAGYLAGGEDRVKKASWRAALGRGGEETMYGPTPIMIEGRESRQRVLEPQDYYEVPFMEPNKNYSVVVAPFVNRSGRMNAGQFIMLEFMRQLSAVKNFTVIDPGMLRQKMLQSRIMTPNNFSLDDVSLVLDGLDADLLLTGEIADYQDYEGTEGRAIVGFSAMIIERKSRSIVWSSRSYNKGDDKVMFFDWGRFTSAHSLASEMIRMVLTQFAEGQKITAM